MKQYFYGEDRHGPYFEGWYFKCQTKDGFCISFIPAMHINKAGEKSASLQIITENRSWYLEYPFSSFSASVDVLDITLAGNCFSEAGICINIEQEDLFLHGRIDFGTFNRLKSDIMGPVRLISNMECVHCIVSMNHILNGKLKLEDRVFDFDGGLGYIEGDRGRSFPSSYLWSQCLWNDCSVFLSVAKITVAKLHFSGCICVIKLNEREYRLATYRGSKIENWSEKGVCLHQGRYRLEIHLLEQMMQHLRAPSSGDMKRTVQESVCAKVRYRFWKGNQLLLDRISSAASYEYSDSSK